MNLQVLRHTRLGRYVFGPLVLLVFGLRALIPVGYMFASVDGHAQLVMCPAGLDRSAGAHQMMGMGSAAAMAHAAHAELLAVHCPYALAGGAGLMASAHEPAEPYFYIVRPAPPPAIAFVPPARPFRLYAPRGPPFFA